MHTLELRKLNNSQETVSNYSKLGIEGTNYLAFRDIPNLVRKYIHGKKALDYGCGAGRSTRFLKSLGLEVSGVDISEKFLESANKEDNNIHYWLIKNGKIPTVGESFDLIFSSLVFLAMSTKKEISTALQEMYRVLKKDGTIIIVTGSQDLHSPNKRWKSYYTQFPENESPTSGKIVKLNIPKVNVTFYDFFWTHQDYLGLFKKADFEIVETLFPKGHVDENKEWKSEMDSSPYVIYVLKKRNA